MKAIEVADTFTARHSDRVSIISIKVAKYLGYEESQLEDLRFGSILHDLGKISQRSILELQKAGPLTEEEYNRIKEHPARGVEILKVNAFFNNEIQSIVRNHHERWDGKGYPDGLAGEAIPLGAQIVAVANAYDVMTSDTPYRTRISSQKAAEEIFECSGTQFSPKVVEAFMQAYKAKEFNGNLDKSER